ncbi:ScbR family autoregulator-binding transcription factor [Streptomyces longwoodensis]|uniref:ScbR family autoregulator-binding transcription factor n=1 Tax=Streptomyces longwoodensis TaxID=68231 RepID=UPI0022539028|nr:ScbR family autoregulator-binding transcription factor [Streptomyces longwoodensis]MCX4997986.1 ScbR family autoregulator-binding transcription factor [Streptomyces longwoodensis]MCX5000585.1 ScbR family autoregulator-binding transcription factor [Streptomyces longwoodensis]MCX5000614.1 ScbR family autoregulator-binding transcription factor [Streptomyces longwoodensis]
MVKQERAARTRQALIEAAAAVFAEEGFAAASLSTISRQAGVSNGALHFHFASKNALADAVEAQACERLARITATAPARPLPLLQRVIDATHALMDALAADTVLRGAFALACEPTRPRQGSPHTHWRHWLEDILRRAERNGALARGIRAADTARTLTAATVGFAVLGADDPSWLGRTHMTALWNTLLPGLAPRQDLPRLRTTGSHPAPPTPHPHPRP